MLSGPVSLNGSPVRLWTYDWYRQGLRSHEIFHYKELVNVGVWNLTYRRFWKIQGDFDSTTYAPSNNTTYPNPLSFTPRYRFTDLGSLKLFALCCPVNIDLVKGRFNAIFQEVYRDSLDGTQNGDTQDFKYIFQ